MNPINWFEIPVNDIEAGSRFYQNVFEIEMQVTEMGGSVMAWFPGSPDQPGATGTLIKAEGYVPSYEGSVVYFSVKSIEDTLDRIVANGGKIVVPKMSIGEYGFIAQFEDNQGNRVALHADQ